MGNTGFAIFGLVSAMLVLLLSMGIMRTLMTLSGKRAANSFGPTGADVSPFAVRHARAHANCYEFLPFVLAVLLYAVATGQTAVTDGLALVFLGARVAQSLVHLASTSNIAVSVRFGFFLLQVGILISWIVTFVRAGLGVAA